MTLAEKEWIEISLHQVVLTWLRGERKTHIRPLVPQFTRIPWTVLSPRISELLDRPDLESANENRARLRLLYIIRSKFMGEIPPDTRWYEVRNLTYGDLAELRAVNFHTWTDPQDKNELANVAARKNLPLRAEPAKWEKPILWGHTTAGPFTIIEGNNRLTSYVASGDTGINIPIIVGLSELHCIWHILDQCDSVLLYDLMRD